MGQQCFMRCWIKMSIQTWIALHSWYVFSWKTGTAFKDSLLFWSTQGICWKCMLMSFFFPRQCHFAGRSTTDISTRNGNDFSPFLTRDRDLKVKHFWSPSPSLPPPEAFSPYSRLCAYVLFSFPPHVCSHLAGQDLGPQTMTKLFAQSASNLNSDNPNRGLLSSLMPQNT